MSKRAAIIQSNYIPWKGYFDIINVVDEFVLFDDMQYTRRDWRNRNKIKTPQGAQWLTIPIETKGKYFQKINQMEISDLNWAKKHWCSICQNYSKTKYFSAYKIVLENLYLEKLSKISLLSEVNYELIKVICHILQVDTKISWSSDFELSEDKNDRLIGICKQIGADRYLSGPSAKDYMDETRFSQAGIQVEWISYTNYREYNQLYGKFEHGVTILDLIFNCGPKAKKYMKSIQ